MQITMTTETFKQQVLPLKNMFFRFALSIVKSVEVAEDITQDVLVKIWEKGDNIKNFKAWGMRLTKNLSLDKLKSAQAKVVSISDKMQMLAAVPSPFENSSFANTNSHVLKALNDLPELQRLAWHLREIEGHSYQYIAASLQISVEQVKVYLHRGRKSMRQKLKPILQK